MTKVISLSNDAYRELKKRKGKGESFSDVVLKMAKARRGWESIMELKGTWVGGDAEEVAKRLMKERGTFRSREIKF